MATTFTSVTRYQPGLALATGGTGGVLDPYGAPEGEPDATNIVTSSFNQQMRVDEHPDE